MALGYDVRQFQYYQLIWGQLLRGYRQQLLLLRLCTLLHATPPFAVTSTLSLKADTTDIVV